MAKKESDWAKIVKYGKWLEQLIGKKRVENWELKPLFEEAIDLLEIEYQFKEDHPFFLMLNQLTKEKVNWAASLKTVLGYEETFKINIAQLTCMRLQNNSRTIHHLFRELAKDQRPWNISYSEIKNKIQLPITKEETFSMLLEVLEKKVKLDEKLEKGEIIPQEDVFELQQLDAWANIHAFEDLYSKIGEKIIVSPKGCRKVRIFLSPMKQKINDNQMFTTENNHCLPLDIIISRMFFEFLFIGGQDYYGYCEYCDSFYIAERKGRKKFCSDPCRTMNQRK